jgi:hypothetical protein
MKKVWGAPVALVCIIAALAAPIATQVASAKTKHHYPPGTLKLPSSKLKHVAGGVVCGKTGAKWVSGTLFAPHRFLSDAQYRLDYLALAKHTHGKLKKHDLSRAGLYGKRAKKHAAVCNPTTGGGTLPPEPAPSIFGVDTGTYDTSQSNFVNDFPTAQGLGAHWDRFTLGTAASQGNYAGIDYQVQLARLHGMGVVLTLGCASGVPCPPTSTSDLASYQAYVGRILAHFKGVVDYYESWAEPNHGSQWGGAANPVQYAALLKAQYQEFQTFNAQTGASMKLLFGSPNGFTIQPGTSDIAVLPFTHQVLDALGGGVKPFDGVALHAYRYPPSAGPNDPVTDYVSTALSYPGLCVPDGSGNCQMNWTQELQAYESEFISHNDGTPAMWLTEWGWPGGDTSSFCGSNPGYCPSVAAQDADLKAAFADLLSPGLSFVKGALWFNQRDYVPGVPNPDPEFFAHYGLLYYNFAQKPAAADFKALSQGNPGR